MVPSQDPGENLTCTVSTAGQKRRRNHYGDQDEASPKTVCPSIKSHRPSELLCTPLQSPTPSEPASPKSTGVLSGVLHVDEEHAHLSKEEILQIRRDVLETFYTKAQQEEDLKRAQAARDHWLWSSIELAATLASDQSTLDTTAVIDSIMAAYEDCKAKNIPPVLFMALHVFRKFNTWSRL
ncbi:hypothetical protein BG006_003015 [Podila minutissima]|uniref:Uncharacterized protein n=1 Tax=Podila minutissima TaxID=64525 RepID=A0A9P5VGH4_9FUNG|nr:hypothetical protein BG006_003015 [Podila minutissima]